MSIEGITMKVTGTVPMYGGEIDVEYAATVHGSGDVCIDDLIRPDGITDLEWDEVWEDIEQLAVDAAVQEFIKWRDSQ